MRKKNSNQSKFPRYFQTYVYFKISVIHLCIKCVTNFHFSQLRMLVKTVNETAT